VVKEGLKNAYTSFFVGRVRRDGLWGALSEGGGIILVPAILLFNTWHTTRRNNWSVVVSIARCWTIYELFDVELYA